MGTKSNPSEFDCYERAQPDEPIFVLLARDPIAPVLVRLWAQLRKLTTIKATTGPKIDEAMSCADKMEQWHKDNRDFTDRSERR